MSTVLRVLFIEDSEDDCLLMQRELRRGGYEPRWRRAQNAAELRDALKQEEWQIALSDYSMPGFGGIAALKILRELAPELPCIIVSGAIGEDAAVNTIREGAQDYVMKDRLARLPVAVGQQLAEAAGRAARYRSEEEARRRSEEVAGLFAISAAASRSLDLAVVLEAALKETLRIVGCGAGAAFVSSEETSALSLAASEGMPDQILQELEAYVGRTLASRKPPVPWIASAMQLFGEQHAGWHSFLVIPLPVPGGSAGALVTGCHRQNELASDTLSLAGGIGRQVATAVENARLHERLQARTRHLEAMLRITETLRSTLPPEKVLSLIAELGTQALEAVGAVILIPDPRGERLVVGALHGSSLLSAAMRLTGIEARSYSIQVQSAHPAAAAYRTERPVYSDAGVAGAIDGLEPAVGRALVPVIDRALGFRTMACFPVGSGSGTLGVLVVFVRRSALTPAERDLLTGIADQAGLSLESARLFAEAQVLRQFNEGIVRGVAEAILIRDSQDRITFANPAAEELLAATRHELERTAWRRLFDARVPPAGGLESGETRRYETEIVSRERGAVPVLISETALATRDGDQGTLTAITDISERVRSERLLVALNRSSLAMAQEMTHHETFSAAAHELRAIGCECVVLFLDEEGSSLELRQSSYAPELVTQATRSLGGESSTLRISLSTIAPWWEKMTSHEAVSLEDGGLLVRQAFPTIDHGEAERVAETFGLRGAIAAPLIIGGRAVGVLLLFSPILRAGDLSAVAVFANHMAAVWHKIDLLVQLRGRLEELQRVQAQLLQAQKMEAIGRLAGGVAHDFNNQLTAIMGTAELLMEEFAGNARVYGELQEINETAQRSAALTRQLLAFSRRQTAHPVVVAVDELLGGMQKMLSRLIGEDVEMDLHQAASGASVLVDAGQLEQVVMNLVVNARDAMPRGGQLRISTSVVALGPAETASRVGIAAGRYTRIDVVDAGMGMDATVRSHLFEPFFTTKPEGQGTGLGLATVYGIVQRFGGFIDVQSEVGKGSTFSVFLPVVGSSVREGALPPVERTGDVGGTETILLVEDEAPVRKLVKRILQRGGYRVLEAPSGDEGAVVEAATTDNIDLLLTDVVMPGTTSGVAMAEAITVRRPGIRVLFMSGYHDDAMKNHGGLAPSARVLGKPFTSAQLLQAVREALDTLRD